jgi:hypothetical protein
VFAVILIVLPVPLSYLNLAIRRPGVGLGFSGLNMALFGFLVVEFAEYLDQYFTSHFGVENAPAFFFSVTAFVAVPHTDSIWGQSVVAVSVFAAVAYSMAFLLSYCPSIDGFKETVNKQGYFELLLVAGALSPAFVTIAFPRNPTTESGIVNIYIHLVGFCIGFIAVYIWVLLSTSAEPEEALPVAP